jgi:hypothetical protein
LSDSKVVLEVDTYLVKVLSTMSGLTEKQILYRFNDEGRELAAKIMKDDFQSNWSTKTFDIDNTPLKIKVKAKFTGYQGRKVGDVVCTYDVGGRGRMVRHNAEDLFNEMVESTLLRGG